MPQTVNNEKIEPVFELIKSMSKAEKRNFKLYATRLSGNQDAKFITLFDLLDTCDEYDEERVLQRCPIKKSQLPNMKAHLYKQLLISLRMLGVQHNPSMQVRETLEFARMLYDKGLHRQAEKLVDKVRVQSQQLNMHTTTLDIVAFQRQIDTLGITREMTANANVSDRLVEQTCTYINNITELSSDTVRLFALHQKLGYVRSQKDLELVKQYFEPRLAFYRNRELSFLERFYYYQSMAWYHYIMHDFVQCYLYAKKWVDLFDSNPQMKELMYDNYLKGYSRILEGLYMMRKYRLFCEVLDRFEVESESLGALCQNANIIAGYILHTNKLHRCFLDGNFEQGICLIATTEEYLSQHGRYISIHQQMLIDYKIACLYFGNGDYQKCMRYLSLITETRDPQIRRDLQCYAKILNLIASYEAGVDYNLDYQIRSVYSFLVKMNDMHSVQREMLQFLKRLNSFYVQDLKAELKGLYERLKVYENHPYERRTFFYLDIMSWLESKISERPLREILRSRKLR